MGSFNLGLVKGPKGDKGETGPKGDTGAKGEKGDKGDNGRDGITPIFTIGETVTLAPGENAYVVTDTENPASPVVSFYIPAGKDGKDASGDMISAIYDTENRGEDIYKYAQNLFEECVKSTGGTLGGALKASESSLTEGAVRNISAGYTLPESGAEGDICIIITDSNSKKLGDCQDGDVFLLEEDGKEVPYIVVAKDYHVKDGVTLLRKYLTEHKGSYNASKKNNYSMTEMDIFLEAVYKHLLEDDIRRKLISVDLENGTYRQCFILSKTDYETVEILKLSANRIARKEPTASPESYFARGMNSQGQLLTNNTSGSFTTALYTEVLRYRPAIVLPADMPVANTVYDGVAAAKLNKPKRGIYMYVQGEWKECASL